MVSLITGFFPRAKPDSSSSSTDGSVPWEDICGPSSARDPWIFLTLFDKMKSLSKQVSEKFCKAADERKKTSSSLPRWGDAYRLRDFPDYHKALRVSERFERLLDKPVSSFRHVALSLDDISKLESCVRGLVEAQSFSLWSIAVMFEFLKDSNYVLEDSGFCQLISSLTKALTNQAQTSYSLQQFLQQTRRESYVSHLPGSMPQSVKHALLTIPSSQKLFSEDVILTSLTLVTNDS